MIKAQRRKFTAEFKSRIVLEALSERRTLGEIAEKFDLHPNQISTWKKEFISKAHLVFELDEPETDSPGIPTDEVPGGTEPVH